MPAAATTYDFGSFGGLAVCVCTYGSDQWGQWGDNALGTAEHAVSSLKAEGVTLIRVHTNDEDSSVAAVRNEGLQQALKSGSKWITYLDGDDELTQAYFSAMHRAMATHGDRPLAYYPAVRTRTLGRTGLRSAWTRIFLPQVWGHEQSSLHPGRRCDGTCLDSSNWLVVGSVSQTALMDEAGGWGDEPVFEDWAMWLRMRALRPEEEWPSVFVPVEKAVYRIVLRPGSRNNAPEQVVKKTRREIISKYVSKRNRRPAPDVL